MKFALWFLDMLSRVGVNTTRWRWKLHRMEQRVERTVKNPGLPTSVHWLGYQHKICQHCGAMVDGKESHCPKCARWVPPIYLYKAFRLLGLMAPGGTAITVYLFLLVIFSVFLLNISIQGMSALTGLNSASVFAFGGMSANLVLDRHDYWRILAFGLVHANLIHLIFNASALFQVGPIIETEIGRARMLSLITLTQVAAALASVYWYETKGMGNVPTVGASGWLFGLIGYGIALFRNSAGAAASYRQVLVQWAVYSLLFGYFIGANNAAHIGGGVAGFIVGMLPRERRSGNTITEGVWPYIATASLALWVVAIGFMGVEIWKYIIALGAANS